MQEAYRTAEERLAERREQEARRFSLEHMPEHARELHRQIGRQLNAYAQEHNLPFTERGLQNCTAALTTAAYAQKLPAVDRITLTDDNRLAVIHKGGVFPRFAEVDADKAALSEPKEAFRDILQTEQRQQEEQQRALEQRMEQNRGMVMSR